MSSLADKGKSLQIINLVPKSFDGRIVHQLELNKENVKKILLHPEVKDRPVVIVSVAGAPRKGKSFLLGFFLKFLETQERMKEDSDWLTGSDMIEGFEWRGGWKGVTSGIHMWSKPFIRLNKYGEKVAVLLMDTRGTFDSDMTVNECAKIFAFSILMSSVQVYNIMQQVHEDNLQHLELFTEYGRMIAEMSEKSNANKSRLIFLIRDWACADDYQYGEKGGDAYIKHILQSKDSQHQELHRLRGNITMCFPNIGGYLLPYPGKAVAQQQSGSVRIQEMDSDFITYIKKFMPYVMSEDKLATKIIDNKDLTGKDLLEYMNVIVDAFENETVPTPLSVFEATVEFGRSMALNTAIDFYERELDKFCSSYKEKVLSASQLEEFHYTLKTKALELFRKNPRIKIKGREEKTEKQLEEKIMKKYTMMTSAIRNRNRELKKCKCLL